MTADDLRDNPLFAGMDSDELELITSLSETEERAAGEVIQSAGDAAAGSVYVVLSGAVEIVMPIAGGELNRTLATKRTGDIFGWASAIDSEQAAATSTAIEPTRLLRFDAGSFRELRERSPATRDHLLEHFLGLMSKDARLLLDLLRASIEWNLQTSGLDQLGLRELVDSHNEATLRLADGSDLEGNLVGFEPGPAGHLLRLRDAGGRLHLVPYHAILCITPHPETPRIK